MQVRRVDRDAPDAGEMAAAAGVLRSGGVVAFPTDTFYGLAVDPRNGDAVERLYELKGRGAAAAMPLVASSVDQALEIGHFGEVELRLVRSFWPGPLTLVVPAHPGLAPRVLAGGRTIAIRVPADAVARALAGALGHPVTSTSANLSGQPAAATPEELPATLASGVDLLLDAGPAAGGRPSTIVEVAGGGPRLVRPGAIAWERVLESLE
ncbi:MAG TPA: L-threonylcarbamoyladenylate synthase [Vicinamibacterales bacterium]|nr:L-threonylcarbamoyladenylate synthase [Vicinamibacterales bacterium]